MLITLFVSTMNYGREEAPHSFSTKSGYYHSLD
jgi:hypothetical protein